MATIVLIVEIVLVLLFVYMACKDNDSTESKCPYCSKKIKPDGFSIDKHTGEHIYHYTCNCGNQWTSK